APAGGVLFRAVMPASPAAKAGIRAGDLLLEYDGVKLDSPDDLKLAAKGGTAKALLWREGRESPARLGGGPPGVVLDERSARAAVRAWRRQRGATSPTTGHQRLQGTRFEVEAVARLVKSSKTLLDSDASEQRLDELQARGELKKFRLIHLATQGETNELQPGRSALILAQDNLPD